jgi:hypothetical protein
MKNLIYLILGTIICLLELSGVLASIIGNEDVAYILSLTFGYFVVGWNISQAVDFLFGTKTMSFLIVLVYIAVWFAGLHLTEYIFFT